MSENKKTNQIQPPEELVLCGASAYNQKFYINENFKNLPDEIKNQLKVMCVLFCADIGGILQLVFDEEGNLEFRTAEHNFLWWLYLICFLIFTHISFPVL
jgi:hypothetical protein